jgi:hypothetical protein
MNLDAPRRVSAARDSLWVRGSLKLLAMLNEAD